MCIRDRYQRRVRGWSSSTMARSPPMSPMKQPADAPTPHWLGNGQAIAAVFVLISTVCLYPSDMVSMYDTHHAIVINLEATSCTTVTYAWSDDLGQLPDVLSVPNSFSTVELGLNQLTAADSTETAQLLDSILQFASKTVQPSEHAGTIVKILSSSTGIEEAQLAVLNRIREVVVTKFGFEHVTVSTVSPSEKALLTWVSLNQLRGRLKPLLTSSPANQPETFGVMDLDSRAAAVAFAPVAGTVHELSTIHSFLLGGSRVSVVTSELKGGGAEAVYDEMRENAWTQRDSCLPQGFHTEQATGLGAYDTCLDRVAAVVKKAAGKQLGKSPQITAAMQFVATGQFALPHSFFNLTKSAPVEAMERSARLLCSDWDFPLIEGSVSHQKESWNRQLLSRVTCFLPAYLSTLLPTVYGVGAQQAGVEFSDRAGDQAAWTLGSCLFDAWGGILSPA
eukprot:TRINITY_DN8228_c0_g1_i13.p1 TRINITY_DN8228_c0_g1~~TRINITY_DN8228_c0_g1_i13.p1  ORF type:complete len:450 (+),score=102.11 TRINITY_DN8228_c0_g1_i13:166-1515(+)